MGTTGLLKLAVPYMRYVPWSAMAGRCVGFDASMVIHVLLTQHAVEILTGSNCWEGFCAAMRDTPQYLGSPGCVLVAVFDGRRVDAELVNSATCGATSRSKERRGQ